MKAIVKGRRVAGRTLMLKRTMILWSLLATVASCATARHSTTDRSTGTRQPAARAQIDHIILGIKDLDQGVALFEKMTGVRPVYGGKHPMGTHNALIALGEGLYLEIIAVQPGHTPPGYFASLDDLSTLVPIGWAVSSPDLAETRHQLGAAGFASTEPVSGSRTTPAGASLSWRTFILQNEFEEAPFFIGWSAEKPHPATTSPAGCSLNHWSIASPRRAVLDRLKDALGLRVETAERAFPSYTLSLRCPKGSVVFQSVSP